MGSGKLTKPVDILKTITGEQLLEKLGKTLPTRQNSKSVMQKVMKGEGYVPIAKEVAKEDSVLQKTMKGEGYVPINDQEKTRRASLRDQAHEVFNNKSLSDSEKQTAIQDMINKEKDYRQSLNPPKRFDDAVLSNYSGENTARKAAENNDSWGSAIRRQNEYKKNGVGGG